jgi:hypothetical protein
VLFYRTQDIERELVRPERRIIHAVIGATTKAIKTVVFAFGVWLASNIVHRTIKRTIYE